VIPLLGLYLMYPIPMHALDVICPSVRGTSSEGDVSYFRDLGFY
jgi:hypothetical protein